MNVPCPTAKQVLIVEDEPDFATLLRSLLETAGYTVATAHDCDDAMVQARRHKPDMITLDIQMPRKSGVFFYRKLKADRAFRDVPVVVVTGLTRDDAVMETLIRTMLDPGHVLPPHAYVEKPIEGPSFLKTIEETLEAACTAVTG